MENTRMFFLGAFGGTVSSFFVPILPFLAMATILVVVNIVTRIIATKKSGKTLDPDFLGKRVLFFVLYFTAILLAQGMSTVFGPFAFFTHAVAFAICTAEFKYFLGDLEILTGIKVWSLVENILKKSK